MRLKLAQAAAVLAASLTGASAQAIDFQFTCMTNDSGVCAAAASQINVSVTDADLNGSAEFTFTNAGAVASTLTDVYWRSSALTGGSTITDSGAGVSFNWGASPNNPGGGIEWNASASADSNSPVSHNGVGPGEWVTFVLGYTGSFDNLVATLSDGIAIHIQGVARSGRSEWAVATTPVPEPQSYALMLAGLGVVGFVAWRRTPR